MKKIVLLLSLIFVFVSDAYCHPPKSIEIAKNVTGKNEIIVAHQVKDPKDHFIKSIVINKNNKKVLNMKFTSQFDSNVQRLVLDDFIAKKGETVSITATCSKYGSLTKKIKI